MAKQQTEEELNLRRKARRRLIGAITLTLAVVVILPMVLDNEPRFTRQDIELGIPAPDKAGEFIPGMAVLEPAEISLLSAPSVADAPPAEPFDAAPDVSQDDPIRPFAAGSSVMDVPVKAQPAAGKQPESGAVDKAGIEGYVVQVGAYASADTARKQLEQLKKWSYNKAYTEKVGDNVRVRVGPYPERKDAERVRQMLEKHDLKPIVMSAH